MIGTANYSGDRKGVADKRTAHIWTPNGEREYLCLCRQVLTRGRGFIAKGRGKGACKSCLLIAAQIAKDAAALTEKEQ